MLKHTVQNKTKRISSNEIFFYIKYMLFKITPQYLQEPTIKTIFTI